MKIICLHPNQLRRMLETLGTTEIQRFQGAHGSAAAAAMAPLAGVTNRKLVQYVFSNEMSAGRGRLSPTLLAAPFRFIPAPGDITVSRSMLAAPFRDPCSHHVAAITMALPHRETPPSTQWRRGFAAPMVKPHLEPK